MEIIPLDTQSMTTIELDVELSVNTQHEKPASAEVASIQAQTSRVEMYMATFPSFVTKPMNKPAPIQTAITGTWFKGGGKIDIATYLAMKRARLLELSPMEIEMPWRIREVLR